MVIGWNSRERDVMKAISVLEISLLCWMLVLRALNSSFVGYLPVRRRKNIASGRGSTPPGAF